MVLILKLFCFVLRKNIVQVYTILQIVSDRKEIVFMMIYWNFLLNKQNNILIHEQRDNQTILWNQIQK
jgi:hypothetical protein